MAQKQHIGVRLPEELLEKIDALAARLSREQGIDVTRANVTRMLIIKGFEAVEAQQRKKQK